MTQCIVDDKGALKKHHRLKCMHVAREMKPFILQFEFNLLHISVTYIVHSQVDYQARPQCC